MMDVHRLWEIKREFIGYSPKLKLGAVYGTPTIAEFHELLDLAMTALGTTPDEFHEDWNNL
jgi:hypothetical protein